MPSHSWPVVAVPVAPPQAVERRAYEVDEIVCVATPEDFQAVGRFYDDFSQTSDEEVIALLATNRKMLVTKAA